MSEILSNHIVATMEATVKSDAAMKLAPATTLAWAALHSFLFAATVSFSQSLLSHLAFRSTPHGFLDTMVMHPYVYAGVVLPAGMTRLSVA
jgi:hypothetical protein